MQLHTLPTVMYGTLHLTFDLGEGSRGDSGQPTLRDVTATLGEVQRALDLGWTAVPVEILLREHAGALPALPHYEVITINMASPLEIAMAIPKEVLTIPIAVGSLTLAIERVLNIKARVLAKREALEADRSEALDRRIAAEARIKERIAAVRGAQGDPIPLRATSAEIHIEDQ